MGYARYDLPNGQEGGYAVAAECDHPDCRTRIYRSLDALCGADPDGYRDPDDAGCGLYFCGLHEDDHECTNPACAVWDAEENMSCDLVRGHHDPDHYDAVGDTWFTETAKETHA